MLSDSITVAASGPDPRPAVIAIDTEFQGAHTLTIQAAMRIDPDVVAVKVYRAPTAPRIPWGFDPHKYLPITPERYGRFFKKIIVHGDQGIPPNLSPGVLVQDLLDRPDLTVLSRHRGRALLDWFDVESCLGTVAAPSNLRRNSRTRRLQTPVLDLTVVAHFLRADFLRVLGRDFLEVLQNSDALDRGKVLIRSRKLIEFVEQTGAFQRPDALLEYLWDDANFYALRVRWRDTMLPFGRASLDALSQTFLGIPKSDALGIEDKRDMLRTFHARPDDAYGYAIADAVNTLLVYEQMQQRDAAIYAAFGFAPAETPTLRATLGSRVSQFLIETTRRQAAGSAILKTRRALLDLMGKGGVALFAERPDASQYGPQTGRVHGGLLYSRSPTRFWHEAPGMLRDVDMSGCYTEIAARTDVYWGRPVILETGAARLSLAEAVGLAQRHADPDGWLIRVTGPVSAAPNVLIPSTDGAVTSTNYRSKLRPGKRRREAQRVFHQEARGDPASVRGSRGARLYSGRIDSGVVTWATWLMIQALPEAQRRDYEQLTADGVIFYPRDLTADDGPGFDELTAKYGVEELPWTAALDLERMELVRREKIDADYVTLRFRLGSFAREIGRRRKEARKDHGKGSGAELAWKLHANTMYGVLASRHLATNNFVAANQITAHARAEAFALGQALNGVQTITDGCTYRLDQIPACTYAECLRIRPDYPVRRAEAGEGVPFLDPAAIPQDDERFVEWYRGHVRRFFGVSGPEYDDLFGRHALEHKTTSTTRSAAFDALACDGCGNYAKLTRDPAGGWRVEDFAARSYGRKSKEALQGWLVRTYSADQLTGLAPVVEEDELLSFVRAAQKARAAVERGVPAVYFPLGLAERRILNYKAIKASAFVFRTPEQRAKVLKQLQKFEERTGAGLELLALRRGYGGRREGSLADVAEALYRLIQDGRDNLTTALNLKKLSDPIMTQADLRVRDVQGRKGEAGRDLDARIDARNIAPALLRTGFVVTAENVDRVQERREEIIVRDPAETRPRLNTPS